MNSDLGLYKELSFAADFANLKLVEEFVDSVVAYDVVDPNDYGNILIAVSEGVNNAIQHGCDGDNSKFVKLCAAVEKDHLKVVIEDEGNGFDFNNLPDPTAPENIEKENGRGVFLMRSLAEKVAFENNGARVELFFKSK
jgi:serine/threonine-protein kinase RsbW